METKLMNEVKEFSMKNSKNFWDAYCFVRETHPEIDPDLAFKVIKKSLRKGILTV